MMRTFNKSLFKSNEPKKQALLVSPVRFCKCNFKSVKANSLFPNQTEYQLETTIENNSITVNSVKFPTIASPTEAINKYIVYIRNIVPETIPVS